MILDEPEKKKKKASHPIVWWEIRRILFNLILILGTEISVRLIRFFVQLEPGEDAVEPFSLFGVLIILNFLYTFNWLGELGERRTKGRRIYVFKIFVYVSLGFIFLSPILNFFRWLINLIAG